MKRVGSVLLLGVLVLTGCGRGSSAPSTADISAAFQTAGASHVVVVPSYVWESAFNQGAMQDVPVEAARRQMAHIDSEVGGTFGQSMFLVQVMDSPEAARALARTRNAAASNQNGIVASEVLVNGRLVGWYAGDQGHAAVFRKTFKAL